MLNDATRLREDDSGFVGAVENVCESRASLREVIAGGRLSWWPQIGIGYYPVESGNGQYDAAYFDNYVGIAETKLGRALMRARCDFVGRHYQGAMVDVGIGSGAFIDMRRGLGRTTFGWDVCPKALQWLEERELLRDPYLTPIKAISLWDVLEHIHDFRSLLANVVEYAFVSIPIFTDYEHVLRSKHYKPKEHVWYFTAPGLITVMKSLGFECIEQSDVETKIGREDIGSFAFRRI